MRERSPWVKVDDHVHRLTPAVGSFAFPPSERYLAWVEGPTRRAVHVTELPSMRTVCTLEAPGVCALSWVGEDVLRVVSVRRRRLSVSRRAVPDGGALGVVDLPGNGLARAVETSANGRVVLVRSTAASEPRDRAFVVGARGDDDVTPLPLGPSSAPLDAARHRESLPSALGPDGHVIALLRRNFVSLDGAVQFVSPAGALRSEVPLPPGGGPLLGWASASQVLVLNVSAQGAPFLLVDRDGSCTQLTALTLRGRLDDRFDLHPERDQILLGFLRGDDRRRFRTFALRLRLDGSPLDVIPLSGVRTAATGVRDGGACWDRDGALLTLTQSPPGVANLARRDAPGAPARRLVRFALPGDCPHGLDLAASPRRTRFVATWTSDFDSDSFARRLALLTVP